MFRDLFRKQKNEPPKTEAENENKWIGDRKMAEKSDWETGEMPARQAHFTIKKSFSKEQMICLRFGHVPQEMEDKWFWYMEGDTLYAHRSWTGFCIYVLTFKEGSDVIRVTANRDPKQYACKNIKEDAETVSELLDWWSQENYDYYHEWLSETLAAIQKNS